MGVPCRSCSMHKRTQRRHEKEKKRGRVTRFSSFLATLTRWWHSSVSTVALLSEKENSADGLDPCSSPAVFSPCPPMLAVLTLDRVCLGLVPFLHPLRSTGSQNPSKCRDVTLLHLGSSGSVVSVIIFRELGVSLVR